MKPTFAPTEPDIIDAARDVAWEYAAMLAAVLEMAKGPKGPTNHQAQEVFMVHVRNLAEFFSQEAESFKKALATAPPPPFPVFRREQRWDNIYAVDFCSAVLWNWSDFKDTKLITAINKTLSHMSYARTAGVRPFNGADHAHGTVMLLCRAWDGFLKSLRPEFRKPLLSGLHEHTRADDPYGLRPLNDFGDRFEKLVKNCGWQLNETPDGHVQLVPYPPHFPYFDAT